MCFIQAMNVAIIAENKRSPYTGRILFSVMSLGNLF